MTGPYLVPRRKLGSQGLEVSTEFVVFMGQIWVLTVSVVKLEQRIKHERSCNRDIRMDVNC